MPFTFSMEPYQRRFLYMFFDYMKKYGYGGYCCFLDQLDLDRIDFKYVPRLTFSERLNGIMGAWTFIRPNTVFIAPCQHDTRNALYMKKHGIETEDTDFICNYMNKNTGVDFSRFMNIRYISGLILGYDKEQLSNGNTGMIILHQLYHKWQFKQNPVLYLANLVAGKFIGYMNSAKSRWFIEGDVRKYIDNEYNSNLNDRFVKVLECIQVYLNGIARLINQEEKFVRIRKKQYMEKLRKTNDEDPEVFGLVLEFLYRQNIIPENIYSKIKEAIR